ncbi:MAG: alpha/beta-type small acid-soluble spore protein [Firmicutes bacterium]|nr:alpha/beta-type small acid-soluble spore protein [Bacillota bacterium]
MARNSNSYVNPTATGALQKFKFEVANEIGLGPAYQQGDLGNLTSRQNGAVGGYMTKKMVELAQSTMAQNAGVTTSLAASAGGDHRAGATLKSGGGR